MLTDAAAIEHEIACFAVAEAPKDGRAPQHEDGKEKVESLYWPFGEYGVVESRGPQMLVRDRRPPERERVRDPVSEQRP